MTVADSVGGRTARGRTGRGRVQATGGPATAAFRTHLETARVAGDPGQLVWATCPAPELDPISLYATARALGFEAVLWLQPAAGRSIVGVGRAWAIEAGGPERFSAAALAWRAVLDGDGGPASAAAAAPGPGPILLGGLGFSGRKPASGDTWAPFGAASLVLPTFTLSRDSSGAVLTTAAGPEQTRGLDPDRLERDWADLVSRCQDRPEAMAGVSPRLPGAAAATAQSIPDRVAWDRIVGLFAGAVGRGRIDKVVLSRRVAYRATADFDLVSALRHLARTAPESTTFAFGRMGATFLGATPERLARTKGRSFETVAIAGSAARGQGAAEDARYAAALLASEKDREEQAVVVETLRSSLAPIVEVMDVPDAPGILKLRHVQHLVTPITGRLREKGGLLALAARLHPTPAVGGAPRDMALEMIAEHEHADRGWYAGPIGWLGADGDGELMVALRCGLVTGSQATLFAGCGIVADSDPATEWEESRLKLRAMGLALGVPGEDG